MRTQANKTTRSGITLASALIAGQIATATSCQAQNRPNTNRPKQTVQQVLSQIPGIHFSQEIPSNFPVPPYPRNVTKTTFSNSTKGTPSAAASIITKDSPQVVYQWYQDFFKRTNWAVKTPSAKGTNLIGKNGQVYILNAEKDQQQLSVFCILNKNNNGTMIDISWTK